MINRLLVATDFSPRSDRALRRSSLLARKLEASLTLVHVVDADRPDELISAERTAASAMLEKYTSTLRDVDGIDADWLVWEEDVHSGILAAADDIAADLIVMGPHRSRLKDVFVGTIVERVVRLTTRPLLVAIDAPGADHQKTLLALDFDEASKNAAAQSLALGVFEHTHVIAMHAFDAPAERMMKRSMASADDVASYVDAEDRAASKKLREMLKVIGLPATCQTVVSTKGSPARTILEVGRDLGVDLIVVGTNQRKGFERILVGSVTANVIREAHRDILIIPVGASD